MRRASNKAIYCECHEGCRQPARFIVSGYEMPICEPCAVEMTPKGQALLRLIGQRRATHPRRRNFTARICECEALRCHGPGACRQAQTATVKTVYGIYKMCVRCAAAMPEQFKVKNPTHRRENPALALVGVGFGNPPCRRRKNPATSRQSSLAQIKSWPGYEKAFAAAKRFHAAEPTRVQVFEIDDGKPGVTRKVVAGLGEAPSIEYTVPMKQSNKYGYHWTHKMGEKGGRKPWWVLDPDTGIVSAVGGTYKATDWFHR